MESQAGKSTTNTPITPLGSSQGVKDSNEPEPPPSNSVTELRQTPMILSMTVKSPVVKGKDLSHGTILNS